MGWSYVRTINVEERMLWFLAHREMLVSQAIHALAISLQCGYHRVMFHSSGLRMGIITDAYQAHIRCKLASTKMTDHLSWLQMK